MPIAPALLSLNVRVCRIFSEAKLLLSNTQRKLESQQHTLHSNFTLWESEVILMLYDRVRDRKVWETEGRTCSKTPQAGIEPGSLQSGPSLYGTAVPGPDNTSSFN